jgi:hypothetical protein
MRTLFEIAPFRRPEFAPSLKGPLPDWLTDIWTTGKDVYKEYTSVEKAEEARRAAEAQAAAAAAQAKAAQAQAAAATAGGVGGIPTSYLVIGGLGLAAVAVIVAIAAK